MTKNPIFGYFFKPLNGQPNLSKLVSDDSHEPTSTGNALHMPKATIPVRFAAGAGVWRLWKITFLRKWRKPDFLVFLRHMNGQLNLSKLVFVRSHDPTTTGNAYAYAMPWPRFRECLLLQLNHALGHSWMCASWNTYFCWKWYMDVVRGQSSIKRRFKTNFWGHIF